MQVRMLVNSEPEEIQETLGTFKQLTTPMECISTPLDTLGLLKRFLMQ